MKLTTHDLIAALRLRYDHHSAQTLFEAARDRAGLADQPAYDAREIAAWRGALARIGDRLDNVWIRLDALLDSPAADGKPEPKTDAKPEVKVEAKPEVKVDAKPEVKVDAKPEVKVEAKPEAKVEATPAEPTAPDAPATDAIETTIAVAGVEVDEGDEVLICGGLGELGDWDPARARKMSRDGDRWLTTLVLSPAAEVAFKFLRRDTEGNVQWEGGENRALVAKPRIDAVWR